MVGASFRFFGFAVLAALACSFFTDLPPAESAPITGSSLQNATSGARNPIAVLEEISQTLPDSTETVALDAELVFNLTRGGDPEAGECIAVLEAVDSLVQEVVDANGAVGLSNTTAQHLAEALDAACLAINVPVPDKGVLRALEALSRLADAMIVTAEPGATRQVGTNHLHIAVVRAPHNTSNLELVFEDDLRANVTVPAEHLSAAGEPVNWKVLWSIRGPEFPGALEREVLSPLLQTEVYASKLPAGQDPAAKPIPLVDLANPITFDQRLVRKIKYSREHSSLPKCRSLSDGEGYVAGSCLSRPVKIPRNTRIVWNPNYRVPEPLGSGGHLAQEPPWMLTGHNPVTHDLFNCTTVVLDPSSSMFKTSDAGSTFGLVEFEGTECYWNLQYLEDYTDQLRDKAFGAGNGECFWDMLVQAFTGRDCVDAIHDESASYQSCMCTSAGSFRVLRTKQDLLHSETKQVSYTYTDPIGSFRSFSLIVILFASTGFLCIFSMMYTANSKLRMALKCMTPDHGFQAVPDLFLAEEEWAAPQLAGIFSWATNGHCENHRDLDVMREEDSVNRSGGGSCCGFVRWIKPTLPDHSKIWLWELGTMAFPVLLDDMEEFEKLDRLEQKSFPFLINSAASLGAFVGLPVNRIICAIPEARCLSWRPANPNVLKGGVTRDVWVQQALGTSMMMAFLDSRQLVGRSILMRQFAKQGKYFDGCHPLGFRELVMRWKVMLKGNLHCRGWYQYSHIWKLIWLQRSDGLWDLNENLAMALQAERDAMQPNIACSSREPLEVENLRALVPEDIKSMFAGKRKLQERFWCALLATTYLEDGNRTYHCFTGWEDEGRMPRGSCFLTLAKMAISNTIRSDLDKAWMAKNEARIPDVVAELKAVAFNVVRSYRNLQDMRLQLAVKEQVEIIEKAEESKLRRELTKKNKKMKSRSAHYNSPDIVNNKDLQCLVMNMQKARRQRTLEQAAGIKGEHVPSYIEQVVRFIPCLLFKRIKFYVQIHGVLRILIPSAIDTFTQAERMIVATMTLINLLSISMAFFIRKQELCCRLVEDNLQDMIKFVEIAPNELRQVINYEENETKTSPFGVVISVLNNYTVWSTSPEGFSCAALTQELGDQVAECDMFPNYSSFWDIVLVGLAASACALPFKILLRKLFSLQRADYTKFWRRPKAPFHQEALGFLGFQKDTLAQSQAKHLEEELEILQEKRGEMLEIMKPSSRCVVRMSGRAPLPANAGDSGGLQTKDNLPSQHSNKDATDPQTQESSRQHVGSHRKDSILHEERLLQPPPPDHWHQEASKHRGCRNKPGTSSGVDVAAGRILSDASISAASQSPEQSVRIKMSVDLHRPRHQHPRRISSSNELLLANRQDKRRSADLGIRAMPMVAPIFSNLLLSKSSQQ